jgi:hypothetical protein
MANPYFTAEVAKGAKEFTEYPGSQIPIFIGD